MACFKVGDKVRIKRGAVSEGLWIAEYEYWSYTFTVERFEWGCVILDTKDVLDDFRVLTSFSEDELTPLTEMENE